MGCLNSKSAAEKTTPGAVGSGYHSQSNKRHNHREKKGIFSKANTLKEWPGSFDNDERTEKAESDANRAIQASAERFLRFILEGAERFFSSLPDSQAVKQVIALTFTNSCAEVTRTKFRLKLDVITALLTSLARELKLPLIEASVPQVEERAMDDGFSRILLAWFSNNPSYEKMISMIAGQAVLNTLYIRYVVNKCVSFEDILAYQFRWVSVNKAATEVFNRFTDGRESMTSEQLGKFLRDVQRSEATDRQALEKFKYRFGGGIHKYNFISYNGSVLTNNAIDPARTSDVWQDMTQSFTHYMVSCVRIETEEDLKRATADGARALVLNINKAGNGKLMVGSCELQTILECVKANGFTTNTYPIILCLSPGTPMPIPVQDEVAKMINDTLESAVAEGLMFEGAMINDPMFSPGALRKKVLVMNHQDRLKPFIGFLVADMNKDGLGVRVTDVMEGTPASKGGVLKDDWLTHINGIPIQNKLHLRETLAQLKVGDEFTVRRENLNEIKVVVGGTIDPQDTTASASLSSITFFNYSNSTDPKPWDTERVPASSLVTTQLTRKDLLTHFAFCTVNSADTSTDLPDAEGTAASLGIQFVDVDNSERCLSWARGRFSDNGRCGYILKTDIDTAKSPELSFRIIGGPRLLNCSPLTSMNVTIHGAGVARMNGSQVSFTDCDQSTIAVVQMTFEANGMERTFTSAFCPALLRYGYRALPSVLSGEERASKKQIHGIYCFIK
ncbi:Phosphatidylinositol-specific phospholipase C, X domain/PDZ domain containing protein, putative [Leishmania lindenbergi]|uniref:Phosphatidylinositol-specific phospholipase C, X domain/PDZ domain containing protein n=1 Tax=Leishmania lindenbergi TaxID=651832 RepID=A0AAW3A2Z3_9TRYP